MTARRPVGWGWPGNHRNLPKDIPLSVEHVLALLGIEADTGWGSEAMACCPVHDDRNPSFSVNVRSGLWHCFSCGAGGSLPGLVVAVLNVPYGAAQDWLRRIDYDAERGSDRDDEPVYTESTLDCFKTPPAKALDHRGITGDAAQAYGIRWQPPGGWVEDALIRGALARGWTPPDRTEEAWILPIRDADSGVLRGWQTKSAHDTRNTWGTCKGNTLFGIERFTPGSTAILVESPLDAAVLLSAGLDGGLASFGANVSERQAQLLRERAGRIVLALDNDDAGRAGQDKLIEHLGGKKLHAFNYGSTGAKDPGDMSDEQLMDGIRTATPLRSRNHPRQHPGRSPGTRRSS